MGAPKENDRFYIGLFLSVLGIEDLAYYFDEGKMVTRCTVHVMKDFLVEAQNVKEKLPCGSFSLTFCETEACLAVSNAKQLSSG